MPAQSRCEPNAETLPEPDSPIQSKQRRIGRHRVNLGPDIEYLAQNRCDTTENRCANDGLFELDLSRVDVSVQVSESDLEMWIDSVGARAGVKRDPARSGDEPCRDFPSEHVGMKGVL